MCDPLTIGGIILTGASYGANMAAQRSVQKARDGAMAAERIRQQGYDREADALNLASRDRYKNFEGKQEERGSALTDLFQSNQVPDQVAPDLMPAPVNNVVVQEAAKQTGKAKAFSNQQGAALGQLRAFGDLLGENSRLQARDAAQVGQIGGFKRGSSALLGSELEAANSAGSGMKMLGDLLGGFGSLGVSAGLGGGTLPGFGGAKTATSLKTTPLAGGGITAPLRLGRIT